MSDSAQPLSERLDALEIRIAYQDETIETLNATITAQWQQIDALTRQVKAFDDRLQQAEANAPAAPGNERPPHY
jgi:SlyX protein